MGDFAADRAVSGDPDVLAVRHDAVFPERRGRREKDGGWEKLAESMHQRLLHLRWISRKTTHSSAPRSLLGGLPFTRGNHLEVLIDGEETFERIFQAIQEAQYYLCVNFFIVKNDKLGTRFQEALIDRARAGVKVYFLFDEIGSHKLPRRYLRELGGWRRVPFVRHQPSLVVAIAVEFPQPPQDRGQRRQDGTHRRTQRRRRIHGARFAIRPWRDTHLKMRGPVVQAVQMVFLEDWFWASNQVPDLHWDTASEAADQIAAVIPTGPADPADSWQLVVAEAANSRTQSCGSRHPISSRTKASSRPFKPPPSAEWTSGS
jgi:cardiolipin synthase A/B